MRPTRGAPSISIAARWPRPQGQAPPGDGVAETLTYTRFPMEHWRRTRTNNAIERLNREIGRHTRVVSTFPDGKSALMLVSARLKCVADSEWVEEVSGRHAAERLITPKSIGRSTKVRKIIDSTTRLDCYREGGETMATSKHYPSDVREADLHRDCAVKGQMPAHMLPSSAWTRGVSRGDSSATAETTDTTQAHRAAATAPSAKPAGYDACATRTTERNAAPEARSAATATSPERGRG